MNISTGDLVAVVIISITVGWWIGFYLHAYLTREDK